MTSQSKKPSILYEAKWEETIIPEQPASKCDHFFEFKDIARCNKCGFGLYGVLKIEKGKPIL